MVTPTETEKHLVRQGWIQTGVVIFGMVLTGALAYGALDKKGDEALATARRAEGKAEAVELNVNTAMLELVRIRTILEERLPASSGNKDGKSN